MLVQWKIRDLPHREPWFNSQYWTGVEEGEQENK